MHSHQLEHQHLSKTLKRLNTKPKTEQNEAQSPGASRAQVPSEALKSLSYQTLPFLSCRIYNTPTENIGPNEI